jgi:hypothetical protein
MLKHESSKLINQWKQWLQNPSQISADQLQNLRCETSTTLRNKEREYLKDKINKLELIIKTKMLRDLYRGIN